MGDVDDGGGCVYVGEKGIWELFVLPSSQFCCELKIVLKNKAICLKDLKQYHTGWFLLKIHMSTDQYAIFHKFKEKSYFQMQCWRVPVNSIT